MNDLFAKRFNELNDAYKVIKWQRSSYDGAFYIERAIWDRWATSAENLIRGALGEQSTHLKNFRQAYANCDSGKASIDVLNAIFLSAKEDFEGGYIFDVELRISGEVFGDFIALAKQSLFEKHKDVAAVLACAALEDALKRYAEVNKIDVSEKTLSEVINALKAAGLVSGPQKSIVESMPRLRNAAMHADWEKITEPDVSSVIGFVEQFLLTKFSG